MKQIGFLTCLALLFTSFFSYSLGDHAARHHHGGADSGSHFDPGSVIGDLLVVLSDPEESIRYERKGQATDKGFVLVDLGSYIHTPYYDISIQIESVEIFRPEVIDLTPFEGRYALRTAFNKEALEQAVAAAQKGYEEAVEEQKHEETLVHELYINKYKCPSSLTVEQAMALARAGETWLEHIKHVLEVGRNLRAEGRSEGAISTARAEELERLTQIQSEKWDALSSLYQQYECPVENLGDAHTDPDLRKVQTRALNFARLRRQKYASWELAVKLLQNVTQD